MDDEPGPCARCASLRQVVWCHAYRAWYCAECRWVITERELEPSGLLVPGALGPGAEVYYTFARPLQAPELA